MLLSTHRFLLVLLTLLQLVAPLIHAHSGNNFAQFGWHLPNFEVYHSQSQICSQPSLHSLSTFNQLDNTIVSISHGIKPQNFLAKISSVDILISQFIFQTTSSYHLIDFIVLLIGIRATNLLSSHPPRAPPAHPLI